MDFLELAHNRQSDRAFDANKKVEKEKIERIVQAANLAPSAFNAEPWHLIVVDDTMKCQEVATALTSMGMNKFGAQAPIHIIIVEERPNFISRLGGWVKNKHFPNIDCGIVASYITLAATAEGLGSCILGWFDEKAMRKSLGIPKGKRIMLDILIGYSTDKYRNKVRKPIKETTSHNQY